MSVSSSLAVCLLVLSHRCYSAIGESVAIGFDGNTARVSLAGYDVERGVEEAFSEAVILPANRTAVINVVDVPRGVAFVVVQVHAYQYNVTLAYDEFKKTGRFTEGISIGLVVDVIDGNNVPSTYVNNDNPNDVQALLAVVAYQGDAPVPGGCNMEFDTEIAPYQKLKITDATVTVDIQPSSTPKISGAAVACEGNGLRHEIYRWFLPEQDFTTDTYFSMIKDALTVDGIRSSGGRKIPSSVSGSKMRRVYSAYPGTGSLYAAVAVMGNYTSAYVPALTYACSPLYWTDTCQVLNSTFSKVLCAVTLFLGFFTTFLGHKYFKTEMFLLGFLSGGLVSYIIIAVVGDYGPSGNIGISVFLGIVLGLAWLGFWWLYAIPLLSILLATLTFGFFCASIAYFSSPAGISYLENDTNFWLTFSLIILCVPLTLSIVPDSANIICCAILGSYAVVISIDHYAGSNLKYIIVNTVRRATSPGFNVAVVCPPFQVKDTCLTFFWAILAISGIIVQLKQNRGKPPFPPGMTIPSGITNSRNQHGERTPLLVESRIPIITVQNEDDDVFDPPGHKWYNDFVKFFKTCAKSPRRI